MLLADFGLSFKLDALDESQYVPWGTYAYMAPEQFDGRFSREGDQYALGCVAYELLAGKHPFEYHFPFSPRDRDILKEKHYTLKPLPLRTLNHEVPMHVDQAILKSLAKKPSERHTSVQNFIQLLQPSVSLSLQTPQYDTRTLHTPPLYPSVHDEARPPTSPFDDPSMSSFGAERREVIYLDVPSQQNFSEVSKSRSSYQNASGKGDKDQVKQTDYSFAIPGSTNGKIEDVSLYRKIEEETARSRSRDPEKVLLNLRLPQEFIEILGPPLQKLGLKFVNDEARDEYISSVRRSYTKVSNRVGLCRALLYIPARILDKASPNNISALRSLCSSFPKGSTVILFSDISKEPAKEIRNILDKQWLDQRKISVFRVPRRDIEDIKKNNNIEEKVIWLTEELHLQELIDRNSEALSVQQMDSNDTDTLVKVIEKLPQLTDNSGRGWRLLLEYADLAMITPKLELTGTARIVAWGLIDDLKGRARLLEKPECEVLGWLLKYVWSLPEISYEEKKDIQRIIRKYILIPSTWSLS